MCYDLAGAETEIFPGELDQYIPPLVMPLSTRGTMSPVTMLSTTSDKRVLVSDEEGYKYMCRRHVTKKLFLKLSF